MSISIYCMCVCVYECLHCHHTWRPSVPSLIGDTEQNAEYDWWRAVCREEWLCKENSHPWMIYTVCFPVIISCCIITLYGFTRQKPGLIEVGKKRRKNRGRMDRAYIFWTQPELYYDICAENTLWNTYRVGIETHICLYFLTEIYPRQNCYFNY